MKKALLAAAVMGAGIAISWIAVAGVKSNIVVSITDVSGIGVRAEGSLADTRNTTDSVKQIYCTITGDRDPVTPPSATCFANDGSRSVTCQTTSAELISVITSLSGDSYLRFDSGSGTCNRVMVGNGSDLRPKTL